MSLSSAFDAYFNAQVRRVLTQMDRDPDSPTYGCFDRNHWHYKIRDFPSSILQQGLFILEHLRKNVEHQTVLPADLAERWGLAAINAFSRQVGRKGDVSEYFPYEDSYPASAFGLYAVTRVLLDWRAAGVKSIDHVDWSGLSRLANRLGSRLETQASNQFAAGVSGLAMASELPELRVSKGLVKTHADRLFRLQHAEGWFEEYGGPDFGYLTVTIDALVDYLEVTGDSRASDSIDKAIRFIANLVGSDNELPWTLNARNTDYVVPYGLVRTAHYNPLASWLVSCLFNRLGDSSHSIWATDDRYHLHYIFASITRSLPFLDYTTVPVGPIRAQQTWLPGCGYVVIRSPENKATAYVAAYKGGLVRLHGDLRSCRTLADHGWRARQGQRVLTSNWWQKDVAVEVCGNQIQIRGVLVPTSPMPSTPFRHFCLRLLAFIFGNTLTPVLKKLMIFRTSRGAEMTFERRITISMDNPSVEIVDHLKLSPHAEVWRSPRQNLRHVASADSFSVEEGMHDFQCIPNKTDLAGVIDSIRHLTFD